MVGGLANGRLLNSTVVSINGPTRIGQVPVMPGDVIPGRNGGVIFIPPQRAEQVVKYSEYTHLEDMFGHQRLRVKKCNAGQFDALWTPEIEKDFHEQLKENEDHLPAPQPLIEELLKGGNSRIKGLGKSTWRAPAPRYNLQNPAANIETFDKYSSENKACQSNFFGSRILVTLSKPIHRLVGTARG